LVFQHTFLSRCQRTRCGYHSSRALAMSRQKSFPLPRCPPPPPHPNPFMGGEWCSDLSSIIRCCFGSLPLPVTRPADRMPNSYVASSAGRTRVLSLDGSTTVTLFFFCSAALLFCTQIRLIFNKCNASPVEEFPGFPSAMVQREQDSLVPGPQLFPPLSPSPTEHFAVRAQFC